MYYFASSNLDFLRSMDWELDLAICYCKAAFEFDCRLFMAFFKASFLI